MSNNISLFGLATVLPSSAQSRNVGQSHQGWLRELEHAQAQMLNRDSQDNGHAAGSPDEQVSSEPRQMAAGAGTTGFESFSSQQRVSKNMFNAYTEKGASTFDTSSSTSESGIAAPIAADGTSASAKISDEPVFATNESPETGESMPGRAQCETSNTVFKFVQSSENVLSAVVRDSSMTLESELRLSQQIRSVVKGAGARLGKIWLNGRAIVNDSLGDEHGS